VRTGLVSRASAASACASGTRPGIQEATRQDVSIPVDCAVKLPGPGSRCARPGHERATSRRAQRTVGRHSRFTMSNSAGLFVPAARCCVRVCPSLRMCLRFRVRRRIRRDSSNPVPPMRGDGAPTGALFLSVAPATRDHPVPGRPGPLSALHRGGFRMRTHASVSRQWDQSRSDCPRQAITAWRSGSGPPYVAVRAASAGRHSLLRLAGSFLENAPSEPGCKSYIINSLRSQEISSYRRRYF
jgi:hypothetical protein